MTDRDEAAPSTGDATSMRSHQDVEDGGRDASTSVAATDTSAAAESVWVRKWDDTTNSLFYFNLRTQESSWEEPPDYKALFDTTPLDTDAEGSLEAQQETAAPVVDSVEPGTEETEQSAASVKIQSLYRGRSTRKRMKGNGQWTKQFDPITARKYYYNSVTGESRWQKPIDFLEGVQDEKSDGAIKIQSVFRAKQARDRVKQLADEEEEEEEAQKLKQQEKEAAEEQVEAKPLSPRAPWSEYFDPRSGKYYYRHAITDAITWEKPEKFVSSWVEGSQRDLAALSIQCAVRKRLATNGVEAKREMLHQLTDPGIMKLKLQELKRVVHEIHAEIEARALMSPQEEEQFPHLAGLLVEWKQSLETISEAVQSLRYLEEGSQPLECLADRILHAESFHKSLAERRSECLSLLRSILLMNSYFVDLDVMRINLACATFHRWKAHELCALADPRMLTIIQGRNLSELLEHVEALLRRAMGLTDFSTGTTSAAGKRYEDWHASVVAALLGVDEMAQQLTHKTQLLLTYHGAEALRKEVALMQEEDLLASRIAKMHQRRLDEAENYAVFLVKCQESWQKGLIQRHEDLQALAAQESDERQEHTKHQATTRKYQEEEQERFSTLKMSIWEAVKEGLAVGIVRAMVFAELRKARQLGYEFLVKSARSDHGETLIQIACWWGHAHLTLVDDIVRTVRLKNHRGKTPFTVAKSDRVRCLLKPAEEGRLPPMRRRRTEGKSTPKGFPRRMTEVGQLQRPPASFIKSKAKAKSMLAKSTKQRSTNDLCM
ncbi:hypothetical protein BBJ28_00000852 [Nothophytophthora sp. Chile5]|nr:hypothetical protein BBJ28_00000852 [Nothophytophthora sp. Chile5]